MRMLGGVLKGLLVLGYLGILLGCHGTSGGGGFGGKDALGDYNMDAVPKADLHGIPSAVGLPPVVAGARGRLDVTGVTGPRNPHVDWNVPLPFSAPSLIQGVLADGTVYVSGNDGVGAVRDGKLAWVYGVYAPSQFGVATDGGLWFTKSGTGQYFALNRNGEGGLLPSSFREPQELWGRLMIGCSGNGRWLRGFGKDIPLEYECTDPQAILGPDNLGYAGTNGPDVRAVTRTGEPVWKIKTPCSAETLMAGPSGRVIFGCKDNSIHLIENGVLKWSVPGDGEMEKPNNNPPASSFDGVMDREGTLYFVDRPEGGVTTHIHALSATGKILWTIETQVFSVSSIAFDAKGRLYMTGQRGMGQRLVSLTD